MSASQEVLFADETRHYLEILQLATSVYDGEAKLSDVELKQMKLSHEGSIPLCYDLLTIRTQEQRYIGIARRASLVHLDSRELEAVGSMWVIFSTSPDSIEQALFVVNGEANGMPMPPATSVLASLNTNGVASHLVDEARRVRTNVALAAWLAFAQIVDLINQSSYVDPVPDALGLAKARKQLGRYGFD